MSVSNEGIVTMQALTLLLVQRLLTGKTSAALQVSGSTKEFFQGTDLVSHVGRESKILVRVTALRLVNDLNTEYWAKVPHKL